MAGWRRKNPQAFRIRSIDRKGRVRGVSLESDRLLLRGFFLTVLLANFEGRPTVILLFLLLYLLHLVVASVRKRWALRRMRRLRPDESPATQRLVTTAATELGLRRPPPVFGDLRNMSFGARMVSGACSSSLIVTGAFEVLAVRNPSHAHAIVLHELTHLKNRDRTFYYFFTLLVCVLADRLWTVPSAVPYLVLQNAVFWVGLLLLIRRRELIADAVAASLATETSTVEEMLTALGERSDLFHPSARRRLIALRSDSPVLRTSLFILALAAFGLAGSIIIVSPFDPVVGLLLLASLALTYGRGIFLELAKGFRRKAPLSRPTASPPDSALPVPAQRSLGGGNQAFFRELLDSGAEAWNRWRAARPLVQPKLEAQDLHGQCFDGFNFQNVALDGADLADTSWDETECAGASLRGVDLSRADLTGSRQLLSADLSGASLTDARLPVETFEAIHRSPVWERARRCGRWMILSLFLSLPLLAALRATSDFDLVLRGRVRVPGISTPSFFLLLVLPLALFVAHFCFVRETKGCLAEIARLPVLDETLTGSRSRISVSSLLARIDSMARRSRLLSVLFYSCSALVFLGSPMVLLVIFLRSLVLHSPERTLPLSLLFAGAATASATIGLAAPPGWRRHALKLELKRAPVWWGLNAGWITLLLSAVAFAGASGIRYPSGLREPDAENFALKVAIEERGMPDSEISEIVLSGHPLLRIPEFLARLGASPFADPEHGWAEGSRLRGADLRQARFVDVHLSSPDLDGADLNGSELTFVALTGASLRHAILENTTWRDAALDGADLRGSFLGGSQWSYIASSSSLRRADLRGATASRESSRLYEVGEVVPVQFEGVDLTRADLSGVDFRGVSFHQAILACADLRAATFGVGGALPHVTSFGYADLRKADLRGATLGASSLKCANLDGADLRGADLRGATHLWAEQLRSAILDETTFLPKFETFEALRPWDCDRAVRRSPEPCGPVAPLEEFDLLVF